VEKKNTEEQVEMKEKHGAGNVGWFIRCVWRKDFIWRGIKLAGVYA
jgi:hypothetical protein